MCPRIRNDMLGVSTVSAADTVLTPGPCHRGAMSSHADLQTESRRRLQEVNGTNVVRTLVVAHAGPDTRVPRGRLGRQARPLLVAALLASLSAAAAGCGSSPSSPAVANLGTTSPSTTTASSPGGAAPSGILAKEEAYTHCMRSHGIPDFPDPTPNSRGGGGFDITAGPGSDLNQSLPKYQAADRVCKELLPGGSRTPAQLAQAVATGVKFVDCMHSHGFPSFPAPNSQDVFNMNGINQNSPLFQSAFKTCTRLASPNGASFSQSGAAAHQGGPAGAGGGAP